MGLFSVRGRLPQPAEPATVRLHSEGSRGQVARWIRALPARLALAARAAIQSTGREVAARLRDVRLAAIAATNDARIVAVLLVLAAIALGVEMAASFHVI